MSRNDMKPTDFVEAKGLCDHLGLEYGSFRNMLRDGNANLPPCIVIGKRRKWRIADVEKWISENTERPNKA